MMAIATPPGAIAFYPLSVHRGDGTGPGALEILPADVYNDTVLLDFSVWFRVGTPPTSFCLELWNKSNTRGYNPAVGQEIALTPVPGIAPALLPLSSAQIFGGAAGPQLALCPLIIPAFHSLLWTFYGGAAGDAVSRFEFSGYGFKMPRGVLVPVWLG